MKKICIVLVLIGLVVFTWFFKWTVIREITRAEIINNIKVDAVDEVDNGIITLEINGQYYDYEYEYNEEFKTVQDRIDNGENVNEWAEVIK